LGRSALSGPAGIETTQCLLFHVGVTPTGQVEDAGYGQAPSCDPTIARRHAEGRPLTDG